MTTEATVISKEEYVRRAAAVFKNAGGMDHPNALDFAEALYASYLEDPQFSDGPEEDAHSDMSYWDDDGGDE